MNVTGSGGQKSMLSIFGMLYSANGLDRPGLSLTDSLIRELILCVLFFSW